VRIAIDAMGGDNAPRCVVEGAALAVSQGGLTEQNLLLVGRKAEIAPQLKELQLESVEVLDASEVVGMDEGPTAAIRGKRDSSIAVAMRAVAGGQADAFVSAGNTGAVVAASSMLLGRLEGVSRPGIAAPVPTRRGPAVVIDVGANIYCKPDHMLQYALMAAEYSRAVFEKPEPNVGLLNIGQEEGKGNPLIQQVHALLQASPVRYGGFIEAQDIMSGKIDVVVCEGFVGNVILKLAEGLASFVGEQIQDAFAKHPPRPEVGAAIRRAFEKLDYAEYGGAPLLGVSAPVMIGHGRSDSHAIMNMILGAGTAVSHDLSRHIVEAISQPARESQR